MKIKCFDKYHKYWLIIEPVDDSIHCDSFCSNCATGNIYFYFSCDNTKKEYCEDPHPERWSDLEQFSIE